MACGPRQRKRPLELARPDRHHLPVRLLIYEGPRLRSPDDRDSSDATGGLDVHLRAARRAADRQTSRPIPELGRQARHGRGLARETTILVGTSYGEMALWIIVVGAGSSIFTLPNTRVIMGSVAQEMRGLARGTRTLVVNVSAVLSIAFARAMLTSVMPVGAMVEIFSGVSHGLSAPAAAPFITGLHVALLLMVAVSVLGFFFSALHGSEHDPRAIREGEY
jgi:hypothetical protein